MTPTPLKYSGGLGKVMAAIFLLYVGAVLLAQLWLVLDPSYVHEEVRLLFAYHRTQDPALFSGDYITSFVEAFPQPLLFDWVTRLWLWGGGDLIVLHRLLPLVCWLAFLAGMAVAARQLGDRLTMLGAVGLAVAQPIYLHQITSAVPHAFAFPLLIWALVAMLQGSAWGLALITLLSGLLYPAAAPLSGLFLAWHVFVTQGVLRRPGLEQLKAMTLLSVTAALSIWLVLGFLSRPEEFGAALEPLQQAGIYPENGPEGRNFYGVFNPIKYVLAKAFTQFRLSTDLYSLLALLAYCMIGIYGFVTLQKGRAAGKALAGFVLSGAALCLLVFLLKPFLSYRFIFYPIFVVLPLLFVVGLQAFCLRLKGVARFSKVATIGVLALFGLALDSLDEKKLGYSWHLGPELNQVMAFAAEQPPATLFAVWPDSALELVPYVARRPLLAMYKAHSPSYEDHLLTMRARTYALIDAYLATDIGSLRDLHCRWGVDYLVVDKTHFAQEDSRPRYFAPFGDRIEEIWRDNQRGSFLLAEPQAEWVALETEDHFILRLKAVAEGDLGNGSPGCGPSPAGAGQG